MLTCPVVDCGSRSYAENPEAVQECVELFLEHGCLLAKQVMSAGYVADLHRSFLESYPQYLVDRDFADALNVGDKRTQITIDMAGPFNSPDVYANPYVLPMLKLILGQELILGGFGVVVSLPGAAEQHLHRDHPNIYELTQEEASDPWVDIVLPPYAVTAIAPLVPMNAVNGTTRLWPGSHLVPKAEGVRLPYLDPVVDPGDYLFFDLRLLHAGTANRSAHPRPILYNLYSRAWFRDSRNYRKQDPIHLSQDEHRRIPEAYRELFRWLPVAR